MQPSPEDHVHPPWSSSYALDCRGVISLVLANCAAVPYECTPGGYAYRLICWQVLSTTRLPARHVRSWRLLAESHPARARSSLATKCVRWTSQSPTLALACSQENVCSTRHRRMLPNPKELITSSGVHRTNGRRMTPLWAGGSRRFSLGSLLLRAPSRGACSSLFLHRQPQVRGTWST